MKPNLKQSLIEHLESVRLDDARLDELEALQRTRSARSWWHSRTLQLFAAACLLVALVVSWLPFEQPDLLHAIAEEAVMNHLAQTPLEVHGTTIAELDGHFDQLGFRLVEPLAPAEGARLLGGRYCSLQGVTAAQLRRHDAQGRTQNLYQVPYRPASMGELPDPALGEQPRTLEMRGLRVDLWVEHGLLFALTRD
ncbi:MAG: hypothetical protein N0E44_09710 [Candidatus Thiodiazotropha lotti]|nr:hypothetical protein [Candidatus Thiodiazotropha lotti]MCW4220158.1 hypothetical protein [Candidatus Thiodiazotropha lotti]